jgi:hypothetical protein
MKIQRLFTMTPATIITVLLTGCAVSDYQYISLESTPGIVIETHETPRLKNLYFSSEMPSRYSLDRDNYKLSFDANLDSYLPRISVAVKAPNKTSLGLSQQVRRKARSSRVSPCGSFDATDTLRSELLFSWVTCPESGADEWYISFDVRSENGTLIASEDIAFELKTNGRYVLADLP